MTISDLQIGQILKEGNYNVKVVFIYANSFEVQYKSGACWTYRQEDLNNGTIQTYIG
jgi:hypothetical protein